MIRTSKIVLYLTVITILVWQLPWCYNFFAAQSYKVPFTLYSTVNGQFISIDHQAGKGLTGTDEDGNTYTANQTDRLLPFLYMRQLIADNNLPDSINGVRITPRDIQLTNFNFRHVSSEINLNKANLYHLMESMSGRVDLELPDDVFRISSRGIEFVNAKNNEIEEDKSKQFTKAMLEKGFTFPARIISGNPSTRKDYDEGYMIVDNAGKLFHMKQTVGRPYVRHIELEEGFDIKYVFINEFKDKKTIAFIVDKHNKFYVLENKSYQLYYTGIDTFNPTEDAITIFGNMFDWTVTVNTEHNVFYYALDANSYSIIKKKTISIEDNHMGGLTFTSYKDKFVRPRISL